MTREPMTIHHVPGLREHRRRYRIDGGSGESRLRNALKTLEQDEQSLLLAQCPEKSLSDVRAALRVLVGK